MVTSYDHAALRAEVSCVLLSPSMIPQSKKVTNSKRKRNKKNKAIIKGVISYIQSNLQREKRAAKSSILDPETSGFSYEGPRFATASITSRTAESRNDIV